MKSLSELTALIIIQICLVIFLPIQADQSNTIDTEHDSEGIPLAHLMSRHIFSKRTRQIILEVNQAELDHLIQTEENVAVLLQDDSKVNYFCYQKSSKNWEILLKNTNLGAHFLRKYLLITSSFEPVYSSPIFDEL